MPLIVFCGTPLTGKTTNAKKLQLYYNKSDDGKCILISDEDKLNELGPNEIYRNESKEKEIRSWLKSEVQRHLSSPERIVILDSINYIKGYRYELHCLIKQFKTTYILIECLPSNFHNFNSLNNNLNDKRAYSLEIYNELLQRYEPPNVSNRWEDRLLQIEFGTELPFESIDSAIFKSVKPKPNRSTQALPLTTDNFLFDLDYQTQNVIKQILSALQNNQLGNIYIKDSTVKVNLNKKVSLIELNKLRRQFINYTKLNPINGKDHIVTAFVQFINNTSNFD